jgi:predicted transposase YdaD
LIIPMEYDKDQVNAIDISVKALFRECPSAALRLAGLNIPPESIRVEDPNVNLPELRADHVFIMPLPSEGYDVVSAMGAQEIAVYLEYQLEPDPSLLPSWFVKCGGLTRQMGIPVVLMVIYLQRGGRATFPDRYRVSLGSLETQFSFTAVRLWEFADRIRSGEFAELAPLLILCEETPTEQVVREEVDLIRKAELPEAVQIDLLGLALRIASRRLPRATLLDFFRKDLSMIRETGIVEEWIAEGEARGEARGEIRGKSEEARNLLIRIGIRRFGVPDEQTRAAIDAITSLETLEQMAERILDVETWQELLD